MTLHYTDSSNPGTLSIDCLLWAIGRSPDVNDLNLAARGATSAAKSSSPPSPSPRGGSSPTDSSAAPPTRTPNSTTPTFPRWCSRTPKSAPSTLTEPEARARYGDAHVTVYQSAFTARYYALMDPADKAPTSYELVCGEGQRERVVGLRILGQGSAEILQGFGVAVKMGATEEDFDHCVAIHPTSAEELVTRR